MPQFCRDPISYREFRDSGIEEAFLLPVPNVKGGRDEIGVPRAGCAPNLQASNAGWVQTGIFDVCLGDAVDYVEAFAPQLIRRGVLGFVGLCAACLVDKHFEKLVSVPTQVGSRLAKQLGIL